MFNSSLLCLRSFWLSKPSQTSLCMISGVSYVTNVEGGSQNVEGRCGLLSMEQTVSKLQSFWVSSFQSFKVPKIQKNISCLLIDIDPISKILKNLLDGSSGAFGRRMFRNSQNAGVPRFWGFRQYYFEKMVRTFLELFGVICRLQILKYLVSGVMVTSARSENHENEWFSAFPEMHPKKYESQLKQDNSTELLG